MNINETQREAEVFFRAAAVARDAAGRDLYAPEIEDVYADACGTAGVSYSYCGPESLVWRAFCEAGARGDAMPVRATGWRFGAIPEAGVSYNFRDQRPEAGVSMMEVDGVESTCDRTYVMFNGGRRQVRVAGWLIETKGTDGESLIVGAVAG